MKPICLLIELLLNRTKAEDDKREAAEIPPGKRSHDGPAMILSTQDPLKLVLNALSKKLTLSLLFVPLFHF